MRAKVMVAVLAASIAAVSCAGDGADPTLASSLPPQGTTAPATGGERAADFTVPTFGGGTFSLTDHLAEDERPVFLNLWASWCPPCREEMPMIDAARVRHPGIEFVGIAVQDSTADASAFAQDIGVGYTLGFDEDGEVDAGYRPLGLPATYIISSDGVLLEEYYGRLSDDIIDQKLAQWFGG